MLIMDMYFIMLSINLSTVYKCDPTTTYLTLLLQHYRSRPKAGCSMVRKGSEDGNENEMVVAYTCL